MPGRPGVDSETAQEGLIYLDIHALAHLSLAALDVFYHSEGYMLMRRVYLTFIA